MKRLICAALVSLAACHEPTRTPERPHNVSSVAGESGRRCFGGRPYVLTDLGTPRSDAGSIAFGVNDGGWVVGLTFGLDLGEESAFLWTPADGFRDLGALPRGARRSRATDINNRGHVVGSSGGRAFLWTAASGMRDLGAPPGSEFSLGDAINDQGQVVGTGGTASGEQHAFLRTPSGEFRDLGTLPGDEASDARDINNSGQVVGVSVPADGVHRAFLWQNGRMRDLGTLPGGNFTQASALNDHGQVVGVSYLTTGGQPVPHPFLWQSGRMTDLGTLPGHASSGAGASAINEQAQAVGASGPAGEDHAFLWTAADGMWDLGTLPGAEYSRALDINNRGQVVGESGAHAVIWTLLSGPTPVHVLRVIRALMAETQSLVPKGRLTPAQARGLVLTLEQADTQLETRHRLAAMSRLREYIRDVRSLIESAQLPRASGQPLIDAATCAINRLS